VALSALGRNVWLLSATSLVTDISSEMLTSVLPLYLLYQLQVSPAALGVVEGVHQGGAALVRLLSGAASDRWQRYRELLATGYGLSAVSKLGLLLVGPSVGSLLAVTWLDRIGKGIRTTPRDGLLSLSVPRHALGTAFGLHRAFDTAGAVLGPALAFSLLHFIPDGYDVVFAVSLALASIGVAIIVTFVKNPQQGPDATPAENAPLARLWSDVGYRAVVVASFVLGLCTASDSLIYLTLQSALHFPRTWIPLLYVATPLVYLALSIPVGRIADKLGHLRVLFVSYSALLAVYVLGASATKIALGLPLLVANVTLLGLHYASSDGVMMALTSRLLPVQRRGVGLGLVSAGVGTGKLLGTIAFGALWSSFGSGVALRALSFALALSLTFALVHVIRKPEAFHEVE
jgi:MFS family permease